MSAFRGIACDGAAEEQEWPAETATPEQQLLRGEFWRIIEQAISRLTSLQQEYVHQRYVQGIPLREVAQASSRSTEAAEQIVFRARVRLRKILQAHGISESDLREYLALTRTDRGFGSPITSNAFPTGP